MDLGPPCLYVSAQVRHKIVDEELVLLDIRRGEYVSFNRTATAMWSALLSTPGLPAAVAELQLRFPADELMLGQDLRAFANGCIEKGYLCSSPDDNVKPPEPCVKPRAVHAFQAWWTLLKTARTLRRDGFCRAYENYCRLVKLPQSLEAVESLAQARRAFATAESFFLSQAAPTDCLPRSLALASFLVGAGLPAEHVIGVRRNPFQAHAWVECLGQTLLDSRANVDTYTELARH